MNNNEAEFVFSFYGSGFVKCYFLYIILFPRNELFFGEAFFNPLCARCNTIFEICRSSGLCTRDAPRFERCVPVTLRWRNVPFFPGRRGKRIPFLLGEKKKIIVGPEWINNRSTSRIEKGGERKREINSVRRNSVPSFILHETYMSPVEIGHD